MTKTLVNDHHLRKNDTGDEINQHVDDTVVDLKLFKFIGLHLSLCSPEWNKYRIAAWMIIGILCVLLTVHTYITYDRIALAPFTFIIWIYNIVSIYKCSLIMANRDRMRIILDVARFTFTSCSLKHPDALVQGQRTLRIILCTLIASTYSMVLAWLMFPDLLQLVFPQVKFSNITWTIIFVIDCTMLAFDVFLWMLFDCYMITVCVALSVQFKTVSAGYEMIGNSRRSPLLNQSSNSVAGSYR